MKRCDAATGGLLLAIDTSTRKLYQLNQFAYVVSHDLQTPLRSISGFVQLLQQQYGDKLDEQATGWIQRTVLNTQRMQTLIRDILAYSHVEARVQPFTKVNLNEVCSVTSSGPTMP